MELVKQLALFAPYLTLAAVPALKPNGRRGLRVYEQQPSDLHAQHVGDGQVLSEFVSSTGSLKCFRRLPAELRSPASMLYRRRSSSIKNLSCRNPNFCAVERNSSFTGDFGLQKSEAKIPAFATTYATAGSQVWCC
jgi:hypothetical protein